MENNLSKRLQNLHHESLDYYINILKENIPNFYSKNGKAGYFNFTSLIHLSDVIEIDNTITSMSPFLKENPKLENKIGKMANDTINLIKTLGKDKNLFFMKLPDHTPFHTVNEFDDDSNVSIRLVYGAQFARNGFGLMLDSQFGFYNP